MISDKPLLLDKPPRPAERSISCGSDIGVQIMAQIALSMISQSSDQTPIKPLRSACNVEADDCAKTSETESTTDGAPPSAAEDEKSSDHFTVVSDAVPPSAEEDEKSSGHFTVVSDITDPSAFDSSFRSYIECSRLDSIDFSLRVEALGPLHEEQDDSVSFEIPNRELLRSSSKDRAIFETGGNDTPPALATRRHSPFDWIADAKHMMNDRFEKIAPRDQDKPVTLSRPSCNKYQFLKFWKAFTLGRPRSRGLEASDGQSAKMGIGSSQNQL